MRHFCSFSNTVLGAETSQEQQQRESFDMTGLVSDLNQFLNTTRREMMTPKTARKLGQQQQQQKQNEVCSSETNDGKSVEEMSKKQGKAINTCSKVDSEEMDHEEEVKTNKNETVKDKSKGAISKVKTDLRRPKVVKKNNEYEETWNCTKCTLINSVKNKVCILCGASFLNTVAPPPKETEKSEKIQSGNNLEKSESSVDLILDARDENDEEMPKRGNVLDRVVQFTALQMLSDSRPTSAMNSRTETPRNSANLEGLEQRPLSAMNANEMIFTPTPIVHRVQNKAHNEQKRISMLEKEETTEILARWKAEHEEREKARRDFFQNFQENPVQIKAKDSVLETQKSLLEQASKNLDQRSSKVTKEIPEQKEIEKISTSTNFPAANAENVVTKQQRQVLLPKGPEKLIRSENSKAATTENKEHNVANKPRKEIVKKHDNNLNAKEAEKNAKEIEKNAKVVEKNNAKIEAENLVQKIFADKPEVPKEQTENKTKSANTKSQKPIPNPKKNAAKFDPSKTPSSFIQKQPNSQSESSESSPPPPASTQSNNFDTSEFLTPDDLTKEVLRQKRLEYFVKIQSPPLTLAKKSTFEKQSEVKKAIELDEHMDHYDVPITPARKVPDSFFRQRNLPHPFKKPKMGTEKKKVSSEKRISTSTVSSEYEPILIDSTLEKSKAAKVVKTKKEENFLKAQQTENPQVHRIEIKALKLSGEMPPPKPQPTRPQRRNKFRKSITPLNEVRTPIISTRKVEEIDDLVAKQVHNNVPQKPAANFERSISVPNEHKQIEAKKLSKKPKMDDFEFERSISVLNENKQIEPKKSPKKPKMDDFELERSISVPNENMQMEPKKFAKKPRNKRFSKEVNKSVPPSKAVDSEKDKWHKEVQKQRNEVEKLQREIQMLQKEVQTPTRELNPTLTQNQEKESRGGGAKQKNIVQRNKKNKNMKQNGAYPKEIRHEKVMSGEIVDDVLYIPGPIKKADFKNSKSQADNNDKQIIPMQAFALIPSDKFDPKNTLTKRKESSKKTKAKKQISNPLQMDEIHVEATLPSPSTRESPKVEDQEDIMQRLEEAIAKGNHKEASVLAKEVTKLQISTKLSLKELIEKKNDKKVEKINLNMYVEDRTSYNGPVQVTVKPDFTLAELKEHVQCEFEIPVGVQKWILGKSLAEDDRSKLSSHGITQSGQSIYLYLVAPKEDAQQQQENSKTKTAAAVVASAAATATSASPQILKKPMEKPMEEYIKGRYWNYEMDRWSYCSSEEDEDEIEADKNIPKVEENGDNKEEEEEEGDYEWEYFYEDAEMKKEQQQKVKVEEKEQKPSGKTQRVNPRDGWECPSCTLLNEPHRPGCEACTTERPKDYEVPPPGPLDTIPRGATAAAEPAKPAQPGPVPSRLKPLVKETPKVEAKKETKEKDDILKNYKKLDDLDIIPNVEPFECIICYLDIEPGDGVVLRECLHTFCKECLAGAIQHSDAPQVTCPFKDDSYSCDMTLLDREIKALVSKTVYEKHQQKSLKEAQVSAKNSFHCKTPDCQGFCFVTDDVNSFKCPICKRLNCITCQAVHEGLDCKQYQQATLNEAQDENSLKTKEWIEGLIKGGEALNCPSCQVILLKKWGCDWVRCTYCRTEICWVTKQLRWGPNGRGDTSGGCKCMVDGRTKCHPLCNYCH